LIDLITKEAVGFVPAAFLYKENHQLGWWFRKSLLAVMRKNPLTNIEMRSANCITIISKDLK